LRSDESVGDGSGLVDAIASHANSVLGDRDSGSFTIEEAIELEFDELLVFSPYTPMDEIRDALNENNASVEDSAIDQRDDIVVLVFRANGSIVQVVNFPRQELDFAGLGELSPISSDTILKIAKNPADPDFIIVSVTSSPTSNH
jgi:hypothetical protein